MERCCHSTVPHRDARLRFFSAESYPRSFFPSLQRSVEVLRPPSKKFNRETEIEFYVASLLEDRAAATFHTCCNSIVFPSDRGSK